MIETMSPMPPSSLWLFIRSAVLWLFLGTFTITWAFLVCIVALFRAHGLIHYMGRFWGRVMVYSMGVEIEVENPEKFHRDGPVIVLANHQSMTDIPVLYWFMPVKIHWMAKASLFKIPIFGWAMYGSGAIPVVRDNRKKAMESLFKAADAVAKGRSVIIFPEGTRSNPDGTMIPFKKGSFVLAKKANVTIQPITIWGANKIVPIQKGRLMQRIYPGKARIVVHDPIPPVDYASMSADDISKLVYKVIDRPMDRLRAISEVLD